jgi:hypothetical protein
MNKKELASRTIEYSALVDEDFIVFTDKDEARDETFTYMMGREYLEVFDSAWQIQSEDRSKPREIIKRFKAAIYDNEENDSGAGVYKKNINISIIDFTK